MAQPAVVKRLSPAAYRDKVLVHLLNRHCSIDLTGAEESRIERAQCYLSPELCAFEIDRARQRPKHEFGRPC